MSIEIKEIRQGTFLDWEEGQPELDVVMQESDDALVMDLYFPNVFEGTITSGVLLEKLREVDGESSGLDADLLDGHHASAFFMKDETLAGKILFGDQDGGATDGGSLSNFKAAFDACVPDELRY